MPLYNTKDALHDARAALRGASDRPRVVESVVAMPRSGTMVVMPRIPDRGVLKLSGRAATGNEKPQVGRAHRPGVWRIVGPDQLVPVTSSPRRASRLPRRSALPSPSC